MIILLRIVLAALLIQAAAQPQPASIEGRVLGPSGEPIARATVALLTAEVPRVNSPPTYTTDGNGKFAIADVKPGSYKLRASRDGFTTVEYGQKGPNGVGIPITITAGQSLKNLSITIVPKGAITGRILDRNGMPAVRATVQAMKFENRGALQGRQLRTIQSVTTDDEGKYRLFSLVPGEYVVSASQGSGISVLSTVSGTIVSALLTTGSGSVLRIPKPDGSFDEQVPVPTYYPGTATVSQTTPVRVRAEETVNGVDFAVRYSPAYRIRGSTASMSSNQIPVVVELVGKQGFWQTRTYPARAEDGTFEIAGILPGEYLLNGLPMVVGDRDIENFDLKSTASMSTVKGRITVEPSASGDTVRNPAIRLALRGIGYAWSDTPRVLPDGSFTIRVVPDEYILTMDNSPAGNPQYLKSARFGSQDALDIFHVQGNEDNILEVVLSSRKASIDGRVIDAKHAPVSNATVVLIPNSPWRHRTDMYLTATTDAAGKFQFGAIPGSYKVFAWEDIEAGAWLDSDFISTLENRGQAVSVTEGGRESVEVSVIPYLP